MSSGEDRKVSRQDIQLVQNLIERCLQLYMNQKEVVETLLVQAKIEPGFTELVWQKLEEENREFFKAYHIRLMVKDQIMVFNKLLERQVEFIRRMAASVAPPLITNGSSHSSLQQAQFYAPEHAVPFPRPESMHNQVVSTNAYLNTNMPSAQNPHMGTIHRMNGEVRIKSEPSYVDTSAYTFGTDGNALGMAPPLVGDTAVPSFENNHVETNPQPLNGSLGDADPPSFGFLGQINRSFSLSDLTADFQHSEILENYSKSPFLGEDVGELLRDCHVEGDNRRLDTISEGLSYDEFCSD